MGTEVLPQLFTFLKVILLTASAGSLFTIVISTMQYYSHKNRGEKEKQQEAKSHIITGLIVIVIILIAYLLLSAIGPAFSILFY